MTKSVAGNASTSSTTHDGDDGRQVQRGVLFCFGVEIKKRSGVLNNLRRRRQRIAGAASSAAAATASTALTFGVLNASAVPLNRYYW
jgi:hypothetical protein